MIVAELLSQVATELDDVDDELVSPSEVSFFAQEAIEELARETRIFVEQNNPDEIRAIGSIFISSNPSSIITDLTINGVSLVSGNISNGPTISITAGNIAATINGTLGYGAIADGPMVIITAPVGTGYTANGYVIVVTASSGTFVTTAFSGGSKLTEIPVLTDTATYTLDERVIDVVSARLVTGKVNLDKTHALHKQAQNTEWESQVADTGLFPTQYMTDYQIGKIRLFETPSTTDTLQMRVVRYPLKKISHTRPSQIVELPFRFENALIPGILARVYGKYNMGQMIDERKAREKRVMFIAKIEEIKRFKNKFSEAKNESAFAAASA